MVSLPQGRQEQSRASHPDDSRITKTITNTRRRRILTYLIPCHLLTTHTLPSSKLLEPFPRLQKLFLPLSRCIRTGDLRNFDLALQEGEEEFVRRRIYLTLERGRDIALRNLLRKVFIAGGFEEAKEAGVAPVRRTRVPVAEFAAAISLGSQESVDPDEVECLLANMIYKVCGAISFAVLILSLCAGMVAACRPQPIPVASRGQSGEKGAWEFTFCPHFMPS